MSDDIIATAFDGVQRAMGGELVDWEGWYWPNHFGDPVAEHHAVRADVGVWDASPLRKWAFAGPDALAAADRLFTNDMLGLEVGQVRYAPFCDENGKMVGDGTVFRTAEDACIVITALDSDLDHFHGVVAGMQVEIEPRTKATPQLGLNGPRSRELLQSLTEADVSSLRYFHFWPELVDVAGVQCWVSRTGYSGELGYELFCSPDGADQLWNAVVGAGARPYGLAAVETIRIESGLIFIGYDYFQHETSPYDMSLDKVIRLDKGDFCGKAALAAEAQNPPNRFVTLEVQGDVPEYGAAVTKDGASVGTLTSPCESPTLGKVTGLSVLRSDLAHPGERVDVAVGDSSAPATVAPLPIYDTDKTRPRT
jgi:glycine cleavage system T protein (aminomethyltransferase)